MSSAQFSDAYLEYLAQGPFVGCMDPWAEAARYFHQIHAGMIGNVIAQISLPLRKMGYVVSQESSLQIAEGRKPDVVLERQPEKFPSQKNHLNYPSAAAAILAEPGITVSVEAPELDALFIRDFDDGALVTVVEVISPRNKSHLEDIERYQADRSRLFLERGVNVVEVDLTRSIQRLFDHEQTRYHPYHTVIFTAEGQIYLVLGEWNQQLKRIALPLRNEVVGVDLQEAYAIAYQQKLIASQIDFREDYTVQGLKFSKLLTDEQREGALRTVSAWQTELARLREA